MFWTLFKCIAYMECMYDVCSILVKGLRWAVSKDAWLLNTLTNCSTRIRPVSAHVINNIINLVCMYVCMYVSIYILYMYVYVCMCVI